MWATTPNLSLFLNFHIFKGRDQIDWNNCSCEFLHHSNAEWNKVETSCSVKLWVVLCNLGSPAVVPHYMGTTYCLIYVHKPPWLHSKLFISRITAKLLGIDSVWNNLSDLSLSLSMHHYNLPHCSLTDCEKRCRCSAVQCLIHQPILWCKWNIYQDNAAPNST